MSFLNTADVDLVTTPIPAATRDSTKEESVDQKVTVADTFGNSVTWTPTGLKFRGNPDACGRLMHKLVMEVGAYVKLPIRPYKNRH